MTRYPHTMTPDEMAEALQERDQELAEARRREGMVGVPIQIEPIRLTLGTAPAVPPPPASQPALAPVDYDNLARAIRRDQEEANPSRGRRSSFNPDRDDRDDDRRPRRSRSYSNPATWALGLIALLALLGLFATLAYLAFGRDNGGGGNVAASAPVPVQPPASNAIQPPNVNCGTGQQMVFANGGWVCQAITPPAPASNKGTDGEFAQADATRDVAAAIRETCNGRCGKGGHGGGNKQTVASPITITNGPLPVPADGYETYRVTLAK